MPSRRAALSSSIEDRILALGADMWSRITHEVPGAFNKDFWVGRILDWAMDDQEFKVDLFRLVDVLPVLQTTDQVRRHIQDYLLKPDRELPPGLSTTLKLSAGKFTGGIAAKALNKSVTEMARRFIVGESPEEALPYLRSLHDEKFAFTVDLLGEATLSEIEADTYERRYMALLDVLAHAVTQWPAQKIVDGPAAHPNPRLNVSVKMSALDPHLDPVDPAGSAQRVLDRLLPMVLLAKNLGAFVNLDMEQWNYHGITLDIFEALATHDQLKSYPHLGIAIQAYTKGAEEDLERLLALAKGRAAPITVRLIKGAYWDYEVVRAQQFGYEVPVFEKKADTDLNFEKLSIMLLKEHQHLVPAFGTHNLRSIVHAIVQAEEIGVPAGAYEFQMLYGMAEPERKVLRDMGHCVRVYAPIGELIPGMAYLVRRLLENTSNEGFLSKTYQQGQDIHTLLAPPVPSESPTSLAFTKSPKQSFTNCPYRDFARPDVQAAFEKTVADTMKELPVRVPLAINGEERFTPDSLRCTSPNDTTLHVAEMSLATVDDVDASVTIAMDAWPEWRDRPLDERAGFLNKLADSLEEDRDRLAALQVYEVAKPWREADADVAEAIDFCRYYAERALIELGPEKQGDIAGENNVMFYEGRGPTAVIAPWNFPLAILCGMTTAALVSGNTVVMKPAEQSSATAYALYKHMTKVGFPNGVVQFLPGRGQEVGPHLVQHPLIAQIAFTGSKSVGLSIVEQAGRTHANQRQVKRVICEMGGKNAIIVDDDADFDEAVGGVINSAFGYAGQKCSACSRAFIVGTAYEPFVRRLVAATESIRITPAHLPQCQLPPVVDEEAYKRLMNVIDTLGPGVEVIYKGTAPQGGYFVPPVILRIDDIHHPIMEQELFGPILAIKPADTFEQSLDEALTTEFALTGAVFSRNPSHLDLARARFRVGNLYLNRGSTGATVNRQPFGGFNMSGLGTKAGGPAYLRNFADPRVITENTLRRGFSPDIME